jgi:divalent metal cation (Fe/Co/Zn/Cd) transporter
VSLIGLSAVLAGYESIRRFLEPQPLTNLGWVLAAALIGSASNELVSRLPDPGGPPDWLRGAGR